MKPTTESPSFEQEYPYGWRFVKRTSPDGAETLDRVPLTLEDVLHPQVGDIIPESKPHEADRRYLTCVFESRPASPPIALVTSDLLIHWGVEDMRDHAPDVAVFVGLQRDPGAVEGTLDVPSYGGRCQLIVELVSPHTRENDVVKKLSHYHRIGIPVYVIIDQPAEGGPRTLRAYRHKPGHYAEIETDDRGRCDVPLLGLMIGLRDKRVVCYDLRTHEELGDYSRITRELQQEKLARERAEQAREQLESEMGEQVEARHQAERAANDARKEADRQREEADRQRQAREQAAATILQLQEQLRLLQGGDANPTV